MVSSRRPLGGASLKQKIFQHQRRPIETFQLFFKQSDKEFSRKFSDQAKPLGQDDKNR
jgi:hypothetical protein